MVIPMAAAAASRLAPAVRSAGGKFMHSSRAGVRSMGSKMLRSSDDKMANNIDKIAKFSNMSLKLMGNISKGVAKVVGILAKHSPALKQQLVVLGKAFSVMIRPIGDIMARFMRPMAVWVMKVAQKWYAMVTKRKGSGMEDTGDKIEQLEKTIEAGKAFGLDTSAAETELAQLREEPEKDRPKLDDSLTSGLTIAWDGLKESLKGVWEIVKQIGGIFWDYLEKPLTAVAEIITFVLSHALDGLSGVLQVVGFALKGLGIVLQGVALGIETVRDLFKVAQAWLGVFGEWVGEKLVQAFDWAITKIKDAWDWIGTKLPEAWDSLKSTIVKVYDWVKNTFISVWDSLLSAMQNMWSGVKSVINKIKFWEKDDDGEFGGGGASGSYAVGGAIDTTGLYKLHAGERVLNAGDTSRNSNSQKNISFATTVNMQATINNDLDIQMVAKQLAELNETELRRRVSYF